jgi:hypothetical protein
MTKTSPQSRIHDVAARGKAIFFGTIQPKLGPDWDDQFVAIDIESGEYQIDPDELTAIRRIRHLRPDGTIFVARAGASATHAIGSWK